MGCPACHHNFIHFWCVLTCSSDQATWTNVSAVQQAYSNNRTVVKEVRTLVLVWDQRVRRSAAPGER